MMKPTLTLLTTLLLAPLAVLSQDGKPSAAPTKARGAAAVPILEPQRNTGAQVGRDASGRPVHTLDAAPSNF